MKEKEILSLKKGDMVMALCGRGYTINNKEDIDNIMKHPNFYIKIT